MEVDIKLPKRFIEYSERLTIKEINGLNLIKVSKYFNIKWDSLYNKLFLLYIKNLIE